MQVTDTIVVKKRQAGNKSAARQLRKNGMVPVVAYGPTSEPAFYAVDPRVFGYQRQAFGNGHLYTVQVEEGASFKALIKAVQRDPITGAYLHVDFYTVDMTRPIRVSVLVELTGKPAGIIDGGLLSQILRTVEVQCLPSAIPEKIVADVSALGVGQSLHMSDLHLPEGVKLTALHDEAIAAVLEPDAAQEVTPAAAATPAPAAAAKAPAKAADKK